MDLINGDFLASSFLVENIICDFFFFLFPWSWPKLTGWYSTQRYMVAYHVKLNWSASSHLYMLKI